MFENYLNAFQKTFQGPYAHTPPQRKQRAAAPRNKLPPKQNSKKTPKGAAHSNPRPKPGSRPRDIDATDRAGGGRSLVETKIHSHQAFKAKAPLLDETGTRPARSCSVGVICPRAQTCTHHGNARVRFIHACFVERR